MTPRQLFYRRLRQEWTYQYKAWRSAIDWTVMLYFIVPGLLFAGGYYATLWREVPGWMQVVPLPVLFVLLYLFASLGTIRVFLEEGDQLFLRQKPLWIHTIRSCGIGYSFIGQALFTLLTAVILLPLLIGAYKLDAVQLTGMFLLTVLFKMLLSLARNILTLRFRSWRKVLLSITTFILGGIAYIGLQTAFWSTPLLLLGSCLVTGLLLVVAIRLRLKMRSSFEQELHNEGVGKMKITAMLLGDFAEKPPLIRRKRPLLFRSSGHLFRKKTAVNGLTEFAVKSFIRQWKQVRMVLQYTAAGTYAVIAAPLILKWIALGLLLVPFGAWLNIFWRDVETAGFVELFRWKPIDLLYAASKTKLIIMLPSFIIWSAIVGWSTFGWWGALLMVPVGYGILYGFVHMLALWSKRKSPVEYS